MLCKCFSVRFSILLVAISWFLNSAAWAERKAAALLDEETAMERSEQVDDVRYKLQIDLSEGSEEFSGVAIIQFNLIRATKDLSIDFVDGTVEKLSVNGTSLDPKNSYNKFFITIPSSHLKLGSNEVGVEYKHAYSTSGNGLYRYKDQEDGATYIYSNFEPYFANLMFPCFDQPNIKARYSLDVKAPDNWSVISAVRESKATPAKNKTKLWHFPETLAFSTYVFSLHAGPYAVWTGKAGKIPLRLFSRKSMSKYVDAKFWMKITQQGFKFYNAYFHHPYPFAKYDQLIVPDFNWGAMENIGAVTFSEKFIPRGTATREEKLDLADTLLHEMAHMWFGNLVTMAWWNDLWLNESFATYMSAVALADATEFKEAWRSFSMDMKQWAYWEDSFSTRHPITVDCPDTDSAFANFDGITYGKGASTLKQLVYYIGESNFRNGLAIYFKRFAFQNTRLTDFIDSIEEGSKVKLNTFVSEWLEKPGTNEMEVKVECKSGKIEEILVNQSAPESAPTLRNHKTAFSFYDLSSNGKLRERAIFPEFYQGSETKYSKFNGQKCPSLINPNKDDYDFVRYAMDQKSIDFLRSSLPKLSDPLDRMLFWQNLWYMVSEAKLNLNVFSQTALTALPEEKQVDIVRMVLRYIAGQRTGKSAVALFPNAKGEELKSRASFIDAWEKLTWQQATTLKDFQMQSVWADAFISIAHTKGAALKLKSVLDQPKIISTKVVHQDRRWNIITKLSAIGTKDTDKIIKQELTRDRSATGEKFALGARAASFDADTKKDMFAQIIDQKSNLKLDQKRVMMRHLFPEGQEELHLRYADQVFNAIPAMIDNVDPHLISEFTETLTPSLCTETSEQMLRKFLERNKKLPVFVSKPLIIMKEQDERCLRIKRTLSR